MKVSSGIRRFLSNYGETTLWSSIFSLLILKFFLITNLSSDLAFLETYKYFSPDSLDWLANGIRFGETDMISFRNPGLVLIIRLLDELSLVRFLPLINNLVFGLLIYTLYSTVKTFAKNKILPYVIIPILFWNYSFQVFSNFILADLYATYLISFSVFFLLKRSFGKSLVFLGLSALFQNFAFFLMPLWGLYIFITDYYTNSEYKLSLHNLLNHIVKNSVKYIQYIILGLNLNLFWFIYKFIKFGNPFFSRVEQFGLLTPNLDNFPWYIISQFTLFGVVPLMLFFVLDWDWKFLFKNKNMSFLFICLVYTFLFWGGLYNWFDRRFLFYLIPFLYPTFFHVWDSVKSRSVNTIILTSVILTIYFTSIPLPSFFTNNIIPLTNFHYISIENNKSLNLKFRHTSVKGMPFPYFAETIYLSNNLKSLKDNDYAKYFNLINDTYKDGQMKVCGFPVDFYKLNTTLLIQKGLSTSDITISSECW